MTGSRFFAAALMAAVFFLLLPASASGQCGEKDCSFWLGSCKPCERCVSGWINKCVADSSCPSCVTPTPTPTSTPATYPYCYFLPDGTSCPGGKCMGGACVTATPCTDTDDGNDKYTKGTCTPATGKTCDDTGGSSCTDYCTGGNSVRDYHCGSSGGCINNGLSCPSGYACSDGACHATTTATPAPTETPKPGDNVKFSEILNAETSLAPMCTKGVREISIRMGNEGSTTWTSSYALVPTTSYQWGTIKVPVTGSVAFGNAATFKFKIAAPSAVGTYPFVWQMKNGAGNLFGLSTVSTTSISVKDCGTSTPSPTSTPSCFDTDTTSTGTTGAVFNYGVKGECTDTGASAVCPGGCSDACASGSEGVVGGTLNEYYCYAKRCYMKQYPCPSTQKCSSGVCVPKSGTPVPTPTSASGTPTPKPTVTTPSPAITDCKALGGTCQTSCIAGQKKQEVPGCEKSWFWKTCCVSVSGDATPPAATAAPPAGTTHCDDGTPKNQCSATKPKYCSVALKLMDYPRKCGCPAGHELSWFGLGNACVESPVKKTQCDEDGTKVGDCSTSKPKWCNAAGKLIDSPKTCGCPEGQTLNIYLNKCVTATAAGSAKTSKCNKDTICQTGLGGENYLTCPEDCPLPKTSSPPSTKTCDDGTPKFACSTVTPGRYCNGLAKLVAVAKCA